MWQGNTYLIEQRCRSEELGCQFEEDDFDLTYLNYPALENSPANAPSYTSYSNYQEQCSGDQRRNGILPVNVITVEDRLKLVDKKPGIKGVRSSPIAIYSLSDCKKTSSTSGGSMMKKVASDKSMGSKYGVTSDKSAELRSIYAKVKMKYDANKKRFKSSSVDGGSTVSSTSTYTTIPEYNGPMYVNSACCDDESVESGIHMKEFTTQVDEFGLSVDVDDDISVFSSSRSSAGDDIDPSTTPNFDNVIKGSSGAGGNRKDGKLYPWQREIGIQCEINSDVDVSHGRERCSESDKFICCMPDVDNNYQEQVSSSPPNNSNKVKSNGEKSGGRRGRLPLRHAMSLDLHKQRGQAYSIQNKRLDEIQEWETGHGKRGRSQSNAESPEGHALIHRFSPSSMPEKVKSWFRPRSKTCSYSSRPVTKPASAFYRTGSTHALPSQSNLSPFGSEWGLDIVKGSRHYSSTSNLSPPSNYSSSSSSCSKASRGGLPDFGYLDITNRNDTLPSPPLSPKPWMFPGRCPEVQIFSPDDGSGDADEVFNHVRRRSSDSIHSQEEDSDTEPSPTMLRQGRRKAIFDSMALGVISAPDGDLSPSNSCDECDTSSAANLSGDKSQGVPSGTAALPNSGERNFQDDLTKVHRKKVLLKRNTVHDFASNKSYQSVFTEHDSKKNKSSFSLVMNKLIDKKGHKGKDSLAELTDVLGMLKPTEFKDHSLISYKSLHWSELIASKEKEKDVMPCSDGEMKRREAVWELFKSECVFLIDHLMVLKHCFMEPMKKVQVEGHLMFAEPQDLFGNLDELCYVSYTFCKDFISLLLKDARVCDFGRTEVLVKALQRLSQLTRDGEVYHDYCLNYSKAVNYLEILRKNDKFCDFERWCENDPRCHRLQLTDLLISPMQHCTKVPLLLFNIRKYTADINERQQLTHSLEKLETSLKKLEAKMNWLKNFERVQEIQQQMLWPPVTELDQKAYIPEFLRSTLSRQPCERLLASPKRQLLHEGPVTLVEISKALDMYMFLFDDILLLTKVKKQPRKKSDGDRNPYAQRAHTEGAVFVVHRQPIALDRFTVHDIQPTDNMVLTASDPLACPLNCTSTRGMTTSFQGEGYQPLINVMSLDVADDEQGLGNLLFGCVPVANGLRHAFVLVQISRFQQIIGVFTIQAHSEAAKETWMNKLKEAQEKYKDVTSVQKTKIGIESGQKPTLSHNNSVIVNCDENAENSSMDNCIMSFLDTKSNAESKSVGNSNVSVGNSNVSVSNVNNSIMDEDNGDNMSNTSHEPIICTPQANFSRATKVGGSCSSEAEVQTTHSGIGDDMSNSSFRTALSSCSSSASVLQTGINGKMAKSVLNNGQNTILPMSTNIKAISPSHKPLNSLHTLKTLDECSFDQPDINPTPTEDEKQPQKATITLTRRQREMKEMKGKPKLRRQITDMAGFQTFLAEQNHLPNKEDAQKFQKSASTSSEPIELSSVKHLVSPTKIQKLRFSDAETRGYNNNNNSTPPVSAQGDNINDDDELFLTVSENGHISQSCSGLDDMLNDTGQLDLDKSPLLGNESTSSSKWSLDGHHRDRSKERQSASKLSRLKAIHEKSQSDIIYI